MKNKNNKLCSVVFVIFLVIFISACDSSSPNDPPRHPPGTWPGDGGSGVSGGQRETEQNFVFTFVPPVNNIPIVSGITISQTGNSYYPTIGTLALSNPEQYTLIEWFYGSVKLDEGPSLELDARNILYNVQGTHNITVVVWQGAVPHSLRISFVVVE